MQRESSAESDLHLCPVPLDRSMIVEIIKGLKYFYAMVIVVFVAFSVAQINLFRARPSVSAAHSWVCTHVLRVTCPKLLQKLCCVNQGLNLLRSLMGLACSIDIMAQKRSLLTLHI